MPGPWLPTLLLLIATNSAPVIASWILRHRVARPLDGGLELADGQRLLGDHKTWRGLAAAVFAGGAIGPWLGLSVVLGALAGASAIVGDALSSFVKRRLCLPPGAWIPGLDQLPEALLPLLVVWRALQLDIGAAAIAVGAFWALDLVGARLLGSSRRRQRPVAPHPPA